MTASPVAQRAWTNHMMFESYHKALLTMKQNHAVPTPPTYSNQPMEFRVDWISMRASGRETLHRKRPQSIPAWISADSSELSVASPQDELSSLKDGHTAAVKRIADDVTYPRPHHQQ